MKPDEKPVDDGPQPARAMPGQDEASPGDYMSRRASASGTVDWWSRSRD